MPHVDLPDGAKLAFDIFGAAHLGRNVPIVLVGGVSSLRGDWGRLSNTLAGVRPGMGDSKLATKDEHHTIELLARDLLFLLTQLQWKELAICGFSMGGVITQQLLFLPHHPDRPTPLPFRVTHILLTGTLCTQLLDPRYGIPIPPRSDHPLSHQDKLNFARASLERTLDPAWVADPRNASRLDHLLRGAISGRPSKVIIKQIRAMRQFDFTGLHAKLPRNVPFLIIHGDLDRVVPPYCSQEILRRIPWAKPLEVGSQSGMVPHLDVGHQWFEYFDAQVWHDVVEGFLTATPNTPLARL
ncbi:Alpha/Beta hydrolase protein, partial [Mycena pura]